MLKAKTPHTSNAHSNKKRLCGSKRVAANQGTLLSFVCTNTPNPSNNSNEKLVLGKSPTKTPKKSSTNKRTLAPAKKRIRKSDQKTYRSSKILKSKGAKILEEIDLIQFNAADCFKKMTDQNNSDVKSSEIVPS